jgi:hypothetical protein
MTGAVRMVAVVVIVRIVAMQQRLSLQAAQKL